MHILLIHQAFVSPKQAGGTRHFEFAKRAIERGHQFTIVASNLTYIDGRRYTDKNCLIIREVISDVDVLRTYTFTKLHKNFFWRVANYLSFTVTSVIAGLRVRNVDLVLGTSPPIFQAVSALALAKLKGKPFMLEIRDLWPEFAIDMQVLKNPLLIWLSRKLENFLYHQADHLLVNSPAYRDYLVQKGCAREKVSLIANGVDPSMFSLQRAGNGFRKQYNLKGKFVVTYAGSLGMANDIPTILNAAERLKDKPAIQFMLVGDGKERKNLEAVQQAKGLENVHFTGPLPKCDMADVLASSDVCLATLMNIPMFKTTYPNKVFDYMAAGRPTILAIDGVIRKVVEKAQGGVFVPPGNAAELADTIISLHENPEWCRNMGHAARHYVVKFFNRNLQAQQFIDLMEAVNHG